MTSKEARKEPLFEILADARPAPDYNGLNWSYSRREALEHCTRRYFYQYYSDGIHDEKLRTQVSFLKKVKNRYLRTGEIVHVIVSTYLKKKNLRRALSRPWLVQWARELFEKDRRYSRHIQAGGPISTDRYPPTLLDEIVNNPQDPNHLPLLADAEQQMLECVNGFFAGGELGVLRDLSERQESLIEEKFSVSGFPTSVSGKVDAAICSGGAATVVDWKTGVASEGGAESLQLATYGIWAAKRFQLPAEQVRIAKAYLRTGEVVYFSAGEEAFASATARILQDIERMVVLHRYGKLGEMDAFTPNPQRGVCRLCQFREVCPEGKVAIHA